MPENPLHLGAILVEKAQHPGKFLASRCRAPTRSGGSQAGFVGDAHQIGHGLRLQLLHHALPMKLHGAQRDSHVVGDFAVDAALRHETRDAALAFRHGGLARGHLGLALLQALAFAADVQRARHGRQQRADTAAFNANAAAAFGVSQGLGAEWEHIRDLGHELDRDNPMYRSQPAIPPLAEAQAPLAAKPAPTAGLDLDFDLDLDTASDAASESDSPSMMGVLHDSDLASEPMELFDAPVAEAATADLIAPSAAAASLREPHPVAPKLDDRGDFEPATTPLKIKSQLATSSPPPAAAPEMLSFDLGALSLDLDRSGPATQPVEEADTDTLDPLATKLALAKEFQSIGDNDGAHALAEEVYGQASGELRAQAKRFLTELGFAHSGFAQSKF